MNAEFDMIAKTFKGLEGVLAEEIVAIGGNDVQIGRRAVSFRGDKSILYKANICLRTASRVLVPIATFRADDADEVYAKAKEIDWEQYMTLSTTFSIDATVYSETFKHSRYVTYKVKDAIADFFNEKYSKRPSVRLTEPDLYINVHIAERTVTISLDSSGESLHKRGWRVATTEAPINEALAAGMLLMAGWKGQSDLYDPMCGSGTIAIEAALIALNIPPGLFRKHFAFENWQDFNRDLFDTLMSDDADEREFEHKIYASDAGYYALQAAAKNVRSAGLQKYIELKQIRMEEIRLTNSQQPTANDQQPITQGALVVINPPYGERLGQDKNIMDLYANIGTALKHQFTGATAWIISANEDALKCIGLKPAEKIHLLNGELDCLYNRYELFQGEHKEWKKNAPIKANSQRPTAKSQRPTANSQRPTANSQRPTAHSQRPTANSQRPTANSQRSTANSQRPTAKSQRPTAKSQRPTANSQQPKNHDRQNSHTDKRVRLSATGRKDSQVPSRAKRPQQAPRVPRRTGQR